MMFNMKKKLRAIGLLCAMLMISALVGCQAESIGGQTSFNLTAASVASTQASLDKTEPEQTEPDANKPEDTSPEEGTTTEDPKPEEPEDPKPEEPEDPKPEENGEPTLDLLVGEWVSASRYDSEWGANLCTNSIAFKADGNGTIDDCEYEYYEDMPEGDWGDGWSIAGRGYATMYFTYTLEGDKLSITYLGFLDEDWGEYDVYTDVFTISYLDEDKLIMDDSYGTYIPDERQSLKELCDALGVDSSIPN